MWPRATARRIAELGPTRAQTNANQYESIRNHVDVTQRVIAGFKMASSLCRAAGTKTAASNRASASYVHARNTWHILSSRAQWQHDFVGIAGPRMHRPLCSTWHRLQERSYLICVVLCRHALSLLRCCGPSGSCTRGQGWLWWSISVRSARHGGLFVVVVPFWHTPGCVGHLVSCALRCTRTGPSCSWAGAAPKARLRRLAAWFANMLAVLVWYSRLHQQLDS